MLLYQLQILSNGGSFVYISISHIVLQEPYQQQFGKGLDSIRVYFPYSGHLYPFSLIYVEI